MRDFTMFFFFQPVIQLRIINNIFFSDSINILGLCYVSGSTLWIRASGIVILEHCGRWRWR